MAKYDQLKDGMSYKEVVDIIGKEGTEQSSSKVGSTVIKTMKWQGDDYEFIFVNDGSPDDSLAVALDIQKSDRHVIVIELSRNFGHHKAIMAGLREATGDLVFRSRGRAV